jgi:hypothetical protein
MNKLGYKKTHHHNVLAIVLVEHRYRRASRDTGLQPIPAAPDATAVLLDQILEWDTHFLLNNHGVVNMAGNAEELGASVVGSAERREPSARSSPYSGAHRHGLNVSDCGGAAEDSDVSREWWLNSGLALATLQRFYQRGFLAANIRTGASVKKQIVIVSSSAGILSEEALLVRLVDRFLEYNGLVEVFSSNVDVSRSGSHGKAHHKAALYELVRIFSHDLSVLASTRLGLISIDHQERRSSVRLLGHKRVL